MSVMDRLGQVVKSEWNARFRREDKQTPLQADASRRHAHPPTSTTTTPTSAAAARAPTVYDVEGALRVLEITGSTTLDDVRRQHRALSRHYHPKTLSDKTDEAHAARVVLDALTDALELLEEHLLPLPSDQAR